MAYSLPQYFISFLSMYLQTFDIWFKLQSEVKKLRNVIQARHVNFQASQKLDVLLPSTRAMITIADSIKVCLPIYHPHSSSSVLCAHAPMIIG